MKKISLALLLVLASTLPVHARSVEDAVLEKLEKEQQRTNEAFERRQQRLEAQMAKQEFREARAQEVRAFLRALIDRDFDAFARMLSKDSRSDVLFILHVPFKGKSLDLSKPGMELLRQLLEAKTPEEIPAKIKPVFLENYTRAYVAANSRLGLTMRDVDMLDLDFQITDPSQGQLTISKRLKGKPAGRELRMIEEDGEWKIDLGLHALRPQIEEAINGKP